MTLAIGASSSTTKSGSLIPHAVGLNLPGQNLSAEFAAILLGIERRYGGTVIPPMRDTGRIAWSVLNFHARETSTPSPSANLVS
jgi:hypothetical protein